MWPFLTPAVMYKFAKPFALLLLTLTFGVFASCNKKEENTSPPTIELIDSDGYITGNTIAGPAQELRFKVKCQGNGTHVLTNFIVSSNGSRVIDEGINTDMLQRDVVLLKTSDPEEIVEFIIRDIDGKEATLQITISLDESAGDTEPIWYNDIVLDAQGVTNGKSFVSLADGTTLNLQDASNNQSLINLLYYYDNIDADENTISSPGANIDDSIISGLSGWTTRNTTRFISKSISLDDFEAINSVIYLVDEYHTSGNRKAKNLKVGDTFSFKDEARNKFGMFRVYDINGQENGSVTISIVIQP
jgi:hypothetical protein